MSVSFIGLEPIKSFIRKKLAPYEPTFADEVGATRFQYFGPVLELAEKLAPEICLEIHPDAEQWQCDAEDIGMVYEANDLSITAEPIEPENFVVHISIPSLRRAYLKKEFSQFGVDLE